MASSSGESRTIQELRKENSALSKEISKLKSLYEQLLHEGPTETFLERRVNILKSQIFQLERQVALLSDVVSTYAGTHQELHSELEAILEQLNSGDRSLDGVTKRVRQLQGRLLKSNRGTLEDNQVPLRFMKDFLHAGSGQSSSPSSFAPKKRATVLDVCLGKSEHVSIQRVGQLESKLAKLFSELLQLRSSLETTPTCVPSLLQPAREHSQSQVTSCCKTVSECCHDLLCLSLLLPTTPWPGLRARDKVPELTASAVMKQLPPAHQNKKVHEVIERTCNYSSYLIDMSRTKCEALERELQFHKSVYTLQVDYVESLFEAVRSGFEKFESSVQGLLCKPLGEVLGAYRVLSSTASETALKEFLTLVQSNASQLNEVLDSFSVSKLQGTTALSKFGEEFYKSLHQLESSKGISCTNR